MQKISQLAATGQILLLLGTHLYFTFRLRFIQRKIPCGIRLSFSGKNNTSYSALATALAATIGTGNIIGISTAIGSRRGRCGVLVLDHRCAWNCNLLWRMFFVHEIPQNGKRWKEDRRSDVCVGERHAAERTCGLIFCVYDISVAWDRQQCAGTFDQCGDNGTDTGIAAYHRHGSGGACGEGDHRWQPADWKSMYLAGSCDECILFRRMYFYPDEKLYGDPGGSKNDRDLCVCAGGCRRGGGWDNGDGGVKNRDFQRAFYK